MRKLCSCRITIACLRYNTELTLEVFMEEERPRKHWPPRPRLDVRPGPRTREAAHAAQLEEQRRDARERQRLCRARRAAVNLLAAQRPFVGTDSIEDTNGIAEDAVFRSTVNRHANRISGGFIRQLMRVGNAHLRAAVMHRIFTTAQVQPLLPAYYAAPGDVRTERQILENIRAELQRTKNPHTSGKLARKRSILEAAVSGIQTDFSRFHLVLRTKKTNVVGAVERLEAASLDSDARFNIPARRKRQGGIPDDVKDAVKAWWTHKTRVSPNRKDIRRKRLGCNDYDTHPAHLLLETQV